MSFRLRRSRLCFVLCFAASSVLLAGLDNSDDKNIYEQAFELLDKQQYDDAIKTYDKAIESGPPSPLAYAGRGLAHLAKKQYKKAISDCQEAIKIDKGNAVAHSTLGSALRQVLDDSKY